MNLIVGHSEHKKVLLDLIKNSSELCIAVAFLKNSGLDIIWNELKVCAKNKGMIQIICGLDFGLTDPKALNRLLHMSEEHSNVKLHLATMNSNHSTFHPKIYFSKKDDHHVLLLGSANLTSGGLINNNECSIATKINQDDILCKQVLNYFNVILENPNTYPASWGHINSYEAYSKEQDNARKSLIKELPTDLFLSNNVQKELQALYKNFKTTNKHKDRLQEYKEAEEILNYIADNPNLSQKEFIPLFEKLVGAKGIKPLWHSGSIYRTKTKVFTHRKEFSKLVKYIKNKQHEAPSIVFEGSKALVNKIKGSGVNTVTEIMMTYNHNDFANLNKNPITVLREKLKLNIKKHRNSYNALDYERYCRLIKEINISLGIKDMLETDSFFNTIFQSL